MQTEPEVLTDHTEVICSTSIERIVTGRNAALAQSVNPPARYYLNADQQHRWWHRQRLGDAAGASLRLLVYRKAGNRHEGDYPQYRPRYMEKPHE